MSAKAKQDLIVSLVIYIGAGILLAMTGSMLPDTALFPRMLLILMLFLNTLNVVMLVRKDRELKGKDVSEPSMLTFETAKMPLVVFLATVVYVRGCPSPILTTTWAALPPLIRPSNPSAIRVSCWARRLPSASPRATT